MSLKLKTDRVLDEFEEMRYLTWSEEENLYNLFCRDDTDYKFHFPFAYNDKTVSERTCQVKVDNRKRGMLIKQD